MLFSAIFSTNKESSQRAANEWRSSVKKKGSRSGTRTHSSHGKHERRNSRQEALGLIDEKPDERPEGERRRRKGRGCMVTTHFSIFRTKCSHIS